MNKITGNTSPAAGPGRPKGSPNKITATLREAILEAAIRAGDGDLVEYLHKIALQQPASFVALIGKLLPSAAPAAPGNVSQPSFSREDRVAIIEAVFGREAVRQIGAQSSTA